MLPNQNKEKKMNRKLKIVSNSRYLFFVLKDFFWNQPNSFYEKILNVGEETKAKEIQSHSEISDYSKLPLKWRERNPID